MKDPFTLDDLPAEYLQEIGRISVFWGQLEYLLGYALVLSLLGEDYKDFRAWSVFIHMAFPQKLDVLGAILSETPGIDNKMMDAYRGTVFPLLKKAQEGRNSVTHQGWFTEHDVVMLLNVNARGKFKMTDRPIKTHDLREISSQIVVASECLYRLLIEPIAPIEDFKT